MPVAADLASLDEDDRIRIIGETAVGKRLIVGFFVYYSRPVYRQA